MKYSTHQITPKEAATGEFTDNRVIYTVTEELLMGVFRLPQRDQNAQVAFLEEKAKRKLMDTYLLE